MKEKGKEKGSFGANANKINRRDFLKKTAKLGVAMTAIGSGVLLKAPPAWAVKSLKGSGEVVVCGWGGSFQDAQREIVFKPFTQETGIKVIDTSWPSTSKVKAQVDSGNVEWDTAHLGLLSTLIMGEKYLEKIDYSYFEEKNYNGIHAVVRKPLICGSYFFSQVLAFNSKKYPLGKNPDSWADFVDFTKFPGKRMFYSALGGGWFFVDASQMGMGVPKEKLYPPDMEKAWGWYNKLKPNCIKWWEQGAEPIQALVNGDVDVTMAYSARVQALKDEGQPFDFTWNGAVTSDIGWSVLKGAKNAQNAMKLIAYASKPELQAALADKFPYGPSNLDAIKYVKPETRPKLVTSPENIDKQVFMNAEWLAEKTLDPAKAKSNREYLAEKFQAWILT